jgi:hypothetical protein
VALAMPYVYGVRLPSQYYSAMRAFDWVRFDWLGVIFSDSCYGGFLARLLVHTLLPLALLGALLGGAAFAWRAMGHSQLRGRLLELALLFLFVLVPTIARTVFSTFACEGFGYDDENATETGAFDTSEQYYLTADYAVRCSFGAYSNPQYEAIRAVAMVSVVLWPVGVPLLFVAVLRRRGASSSASFLMREYEPDFYWWEV